LAEAVTRVANTVAQVTDAQLALQTLSGRLAEVVLELRQEVRIAAGAERIEAAAG